MTLDIKLTSAGQGFNLDIDLSLSTSKVTALFGPSGSGKTSLLRAIAGLGNQQDASISFDGESWQSNSRDKCEFVPT